MDDLDDILDSALDDFQKLDVDRNSSGKLPSAGGESTPREESAVDRSAINSAGPSGSDRISDGTIGQGLGLGLPGLDVVGKKKTGRRKAGAGAGAGAPSSSVRDDAKGAETSAIRAGDGMQPPQRPLSATVEHLARQTRETVGNIAVVDEDNGMGDELVECLIKQFEDLGSSPDVQSMMDTMMRQLLSKEVLYEPMKEIGERYPEWLAVKKSQLSKEDYDRYSQQHQFIVQLNDVYEKTPDNFAKIMDLMQNMQNCGQPPSDIVKELAPGLDVDQDGLPMLPDFSALGGGPGGNQCSVM